MSGEVYLVLRNEGREVDVFDDLATAQSWADYQGLRVRAEPILNAEFVATVIADERAEDARLATS